MWSDTAKKELRWLYKNCPMWGGHLSRGEPVQLNSPLQNLLENGYIRPVDGGYVVTQRGIDFAFN